MGEMGETFETVETVEIVETVETAETVETLETLERSGWFFDRVVNHGFCGLMGFLVDPWFYYPRGGGFSTPAGISHATIILTDCAHLVPWLYHM